MQQNTEAKYRTLQYASASRAKNKLHIAVNRNSITAPTRGIYRTFRSNSPGITVKIFTVTVITDGFSKDFFTVSAGFPAVFRGNFIVTAPVPDSS